MSLWLLNPLLALAAIFQSTFIPALSIAGFKLDLALMLVVARGVAPRGDDAFVWGLLLGSFLDIISGAPLGTFTLALTLVGALTAWNALSGVRGNLVFIPAAMVVATLTQHLVVLTVLSLFARPVDWNASLLFITLPSAILNTVVLPVVYFPMQWLLRDPRAY